MRSAIIVPIVHPSRTVTPPKSWKRKSKRPHQHVPHNWFDSDLDMHEDKYTTPITWEGVEWGEE